MTGGYIKRLPRVSEDTLDPETVETVKTVGTFEVMGSVLLPPPENFECVTLFTFQTATPAVPPNGLEGGTLEWWHPMGHSHQLEDIF